VGKDEYFIQCGKYIEFNPVRKELTANAQEYPYSSYRFYALGEKDALITEDMFYTSLGETQKDRQKTYRKMIIENLVTASYSNRAWGSKDQRYNETRKIQHHFS